MSGRLAVRLLALAVRTLLRTRRRTGITLASLVLAQVALIWTFAFTVAGREMQIEQVCGTVTGHLQLQAPGYFETERPDAVLPAPVPLARLREVAPEVVGTEARAGFFGWLEHGDRSHVVAGRAVQGAAAGGRWRPNVVRGGALPDGDPRLTGPFDVLVGQGVAKALGVGPGDLAFLTFRRADGRLDDAQVRVRGVTDEGTPLGDRRMLTIALPAAQRLLGLGTAAHRQLVYLADRRAAEPVAERLSAALGPGVVALPWPVVNPQLRRYTRLSVSYMAILAGAVVVVSLLGILGVIGMSVAERVREFGLLAAMGLSPGGLFAAVLFEAVVLGASTVLLASGLAWGIIAWVGWRGFDFAALVGEAIVLDGVRLDMVIRPVADPAHFALAAALVLGTACVASLVPAVRVARRDPLASIDA